MEFNRNKYHVYDRNHLMMIHWMLNPGMVVNELVLGQKVPKVILEDKISDRPRYERTFVPCPHCKTLHDARTWSFRNNTGAKNWFGLYCPSCGGVIPCLPNFTSLLILTVTFPLWVWFRKYYRKQWLAKQPERYKKIRTAIVPDPFANQGWIAFGIAFGLIMFLLTAIVFPLVSDVKIELLDIVTGLPVWLIGGLAWGLFMKIYVADKDDDTNNQEEYLEYKLKNSRHTSNRLQRRRLNIILPIPFAIGMGMRLV